ncbi:hypothetical protein [Streptomyces hygroscopicus]|uniref:hypothetical protein n=1 Tax=Streptomyces hygroscopicus TaxID=1912 RepID=UPI0007810525
MVAGGGGRDEPARGAAGRSGAAVGGGARRGRARWLRAGVTCFVRFVCLICLTFCVCIGFVCFGCVGFVCFRFFRCLVSGGRLAVGRWDAERAGCATGSARADPAHAWGACFWGPCSGHVCVWHACFWGA